MQRCKQTASLLLLLPLLLISCTKSSPTDNVDPTDTIKQRGTRQIIIDLNEAEGESFSETLAAAQGVGASGSNLSVAWDELETAPGVYEPTIDFLAIAESYFPAVNIPILLMIGPIDTNVERLPSDLKGKALDDPEVIDRYKKLLDHVFTKIPTLALDGIALGNEVDVYLGADTAAWGAYTRLYEAAAAHVRTIRPNLPIGVKVRLEGLTGPFATQATRLNQGSDVILATHYPLTDGRVHPPSGIRTDFAALVARYPNRPIRLAELGYPSSSTNGSSEQMQADFIRESFAAWDEQIDHITAISFSIMSDRSQAEVEEYGRYYGLDEISFLEFLRTLGLRNHDGTPKPAFTQLGKEAEKRGW